ncbi:MAG: glycoside hydrolase family 25 protein [Oscillospiraceae bacterium]|nr:glycoside hydrolase family 25 protein [Oscillospiraceae bacterium]
MSEENKRPDAQTHLHKLRKITLIETGVIAALVIAVIGLTAALSAKKPESVPVALSTTPVTEPQETEATDEKGKIFLFQDGANGEIYLPVFSNVPVCNYDHEKIINRNGMVYYVEDEQITSKFGVDISSHQGIIDWETVKEAGVEFALIRAGYRGYGSGELVEDERFHENMQGAMDAGIEVGVYFFSQAITPEEALEEADLTLSMIEGYEFSYPVIFDWEFVSAAEARTSNISVTGLTDCTVAFCKAIEEAGYRPMVYQNKRTSLFKLDLSQIADYDFWLEEYNDRPGYYYHYDIWQYTENGTVPGIQGEVDLNICFTDYTAGT